MYDLLGSYRTTAELSVFVFVASVIHLAQVSSLSTFKDCETCVWIIRLNIGYTLLIGTHLYKTLIFM